ncbi:ATP-grasp domain-containing protein [Cellulosilyticum sp. I15G10I2]|uniref:ATP-grasp domain-containing protein n=1 Tax=Cellulosilyticum sp. I15G10I2 TaxID=1892843 RepID=UPI00085BDCB9|nr:ATP-grasp domain-containing protein [Cellulosilyticum sp. I15G10I2]
MNFNGINQIGIVGGGSAALMLALEASKKGIHTTLLDPQIDCVGAQVVTEHIIATITNESIQKLSLRSDVVVFNTSLPYVLNTKLHASTYPSRQVMNRLSDKKELLDLLEELQIPTITTYYQDNKADTFDKIENLTFPFRFIKQYADRIESMDITSAEDAADFILEEEKADSFLLQPITHYTSIIACLAIVDSDGKITLYDPLEEKFEGDTLCTIQIANDLSKTMLQKIGRYNKKLLKEIAGQGIYTIKYGLKPNKGVEFIEITPEISISGILTLEAYDMSIYEQYIHMLLNMKVIGPTLINNVHGIIKQDHSTKSINTPYHIYNVGITRLYVTPNE